MTPAPGWKRLFRREENHRHLEENISEEFLFHLEELTDRLMAEGLSEDEARARARAQFGDAEKARDGCRDLGEKRLRSEGIGRFFSTLTRDVRIGLRGMARRPGHTFVVITCLALGIGATTSIFSVLHPVILKPLPFGDPDRLVMVWETFRTRNMTEGACSYPNLEEWRAQNRVFAGIGGFHPTRHTLTGIDLPERIHGGRADAEFFRILGVPAARGRLLTAEDDVAGAADVVVVSHGFWQRYLQADPDAIGRTVELDGITHAVIGILPPEFDFPVAVAGAEVWTATAREQNERQHREWPVLLAVGRLNEGIDLATAQTHMEAIAEQLTAEFPETNTEHGFNLVSLHSQTSSRVRTLLFLLGGATLLVLLIACTNVANLLLSRSGRRGELAVRASLGAGRSALVRQVLTESILYGLLGGVLGIVLAWWGTRILTVLIPADFPRLGEIAVNTPVLIFSLGIAVATGLIFGSLPAWQFARVNLSSALSDAGRHTSAPVQRLARRGLIVLETGLALILLIGAGLLIRSFRNMMEVDPGFDPKNVLTFSMSQRWQDYHVIRRGEFYLSMSEQIAALPGIRAAGAGSHIPLERGFRTTFLKAGQDEIPSGERPSTLYYSVTPSYFETLRIPLIRGRMFTGDESRETPGVILINQTAARMWWPDSDPIGQHIHPEVDITSLDPTEMEIIGIVGDVADSDLDAAPLPCMYVPCTQQTWPYGTFVIRTGDDPLAAASAVRDLVGSHTSEAAFSFRPLDTGLERSITARRFPMTLFSLYAGIALVLAAVGIYGVLSRAVIQRHHEIGIRMALGAGPSGIVGLFMWEGLQLAGIGLGLGLIAALFLSRVMSGLLFGIEPTDSLTFAAVAALLLVVATAACWVPTRRATRVDPVDTLKSD